VELVTLVVMEMETEMEMAPQWDVVPCEGVVK
jgi:hypothetical protein